MTPRFFVLTSGRRIAFDVYGDPEGTPCFYFHGWPSSRIQGALMDDVGRELGLCIVAMDRPGIGQSDYHAGRRLRDWPNVIEELAAHLGWEKFHLFGVSGGGPYVLVTAHALPERVLSASYICGAPPLRLFGTREMFWPYRLVLALRNWLPWMLAPAFRISSAISRLKPNQAPLSWLMAMISPRDREAMQDPKTFNIIVESFRECLISGVPSVRADGDIYLDDWQFDLKDIRVPVHVWHGRRDRNIPWSYAQRVASAMPLAIPHWCDDEGHYSLPVLRAREIAMTATTTQGITSPEPA
jgi:pimeloyl-ACP methyl ester carboxylesterase